MARSNFLHPRRSTLARRVAVIVEAAKPSRPPRVAPSRQCTGEAHPDRDGWTSRVSGPIGSMMT